MGGLWRGGVCGISTQAEDSPTLDPGQSFWAAGPSLAVKLQLAASGKGTSAFLLGLASWFP